MALPRARRAAPTTWQVGCAASNSHALTASGSCEQPQPSHTHRRAAHTCTHSDLLGRAAAKGKDLAGKLPSQLSGDDASSVIIIMGDKFGKQLAVEGPNPVVDKLLQRGGALRAPEFEAVVRMLCLQLKTL